MKKITNDTQGGHIEGDKITAMERDQEKRSVLCVMLKNIEEGPYVYLHFSLPSAYFGTANIGDSF